MAQRHVSVCGRGEVEIIPDAAQVMLEVEARKPSAVDAKARVDAVSQAVCTALAACDGIAERQVTTSQLRLAPQYRWDATANEQVLTDYMCSQSILVKVEHLSNNLLSAVLDAAVQAGGDDLRVQNVQTTLSRAAQAAANSEARKLAVQDALSTAAELAEAAGIRLGPVLSLSDGSAPALAPHMMMAMEGFAGGAPRAAAKMVGEMNVGELTVSATVNAVLGILSE